MQIAVVTGASSGIGEATARELARRGWTCVLLARREDRLRVLAEAIGGEYEVCDVSDRAKVDAVASRVRERVSLVRVIRSPSNSILNEVYIHVLRYMCNLSIYKFTIMPLIKRKMAVPLRNCLSKHA